MREWTDPRDGIRYRLMTVVRRGEAVVWSHEGFWRSPVGDWRRVEDLDQDSLMRLVDRARAADQGRDGRGMEASGD